MTDTHIAKLMWDSYAVQAGGKTFDGKPLPTWDELGEDRQSCWVAAASVTADRIETLEEALRTIYECCDETGNCSVVRRIARKALEKKTQLEYTENYGQGSEPWLEEGEKDE